MGWIPSLKPRGLTRILRFEFFMNLRSIRSVILLGVVMVIVLGGAFGLSGLGPPGPQINELHVIWTHPIHVEGDPTRLGVSVWVSDAFGNPQDGAVVHLAPFFAEGAGTSNSLPTNSQGFAVFTDLEEGGYDVWIEAGGSELHEFQSVFGASIGKLVVEKRQFDLDRDGANGDLAVHALRFNGSPLSNWPVLLNESAVGRTDSNGFFFIQLKNGVYNLTLEDPPELWESLVFVQEPDFGPPYLEGPDAFLMFYSLFLFALVGPLVAIVYAFDAITKERASRTLDLLLVRPVSISGIVFGKFIGTLGAILIPTTAIALGALAAIWALTGTPPSPSFALGFFAMSWLLVAIYALMTILMSSLFNSTASALFSAVAVWLLFSVFFSTIVFLIASGLSISPGSEEFATMRLYLFSANPTTLFQLLILSILPSNLMLSPYLEGFGIVEHTSVPIIASVVWVLGLLVLTPLIFKRRIRE